MRHSAPGRTRRSAKPAVILAGLAVVIGLVPGISSAANMDKLFSASIDPTEVPASTTDVPMRLTFRNENPPGNPIGIGSLRVAIPSGFADVAVTALTASNGRAWSSSIGSGTIDLNTSGQGKLMSGQVLTLDITATTPCVPADYVWTTRAWVATDFISSQFSLKDGTTQPTVTVQAGTSATRLDIVSTMDAAGDPLPVDIDGHLYVAQGSSFGLLVRADAPVCSDTPVTITPGSLSGTLTGTILAGQTDVTFTGLSFGDLASEGLQVCADDGPAGLAGDCVTLDVLKSVVTQQGITTTDPFVFGGTGGTTAGLTSSTTIDTQCDTDATNPTCVTLFVPQDVSGTMTGALTPCDGCKTLEVRFLGDLTGLTREHHATMVVECDKTRCKGSPANFGFSVDPDAVPGDGYVPAPDCAGKDTIGPDQTFCVDRVQSHKDSASDLILYLLFFRDIKGKG